MDIFIANFLLQNLQCFFFIVITLLMHTVSTLENVLTFLILAWYWRSRIRYLHLPYAPKNVCKLLMNKITDASINMFIIPGCVTMVGIAYISSTVSIFSSNTCDDYENEPECHTRLSSSR